MKRDEEGERLFQTIIQNRNVIDSRARMAYAHWLIKHGHDERALLISEQLKLPELKIKYRSMSHRHDGNVTSKLHPECAKCEMRIRLMLVVNGIRDNLKRNAKQLASEIPGIRSARKGTKKDYFIRATFQDGAEFELMFTGGFVSLAICESHEIWYLHAEAFIQNTPIHTVLPHFGKVIRVD